MVYYIFRDEDMMSMASLLSTHNSDIAPLEDFEDIEGTFSIKFKLIINFKNCKKKNYNIGTSHFLYLFYFYVGCNNSITLNCVILDTIIDFKIVQLIFFIYFIFNSLKY